MNKWKNKHLLLLGDSIMYGSGNGGYGVGEYLENSLNIKLHKYCLGGARVGFREGKDWVVEQVRRAIKDEVSVDLIIFDGFTNDCCKSGNNDYCDVPLGEVPENVPDIFDVTKEDDFSTCFSSIASAMKKYFPKAKCLFIRPHRMGRRGEIEQIQYGERAVEICKNFGIAVCDLYKDSGLDTFLPEHRDRYTCDSYGWGTGDCTHPTSLGYEEKYMPLIEKALKNL